MSNKSIVLTAIVTVFGWYAYFAGSALWANESEAVVVVFPNSRLVSNLHPNTSIISINAWSITLVSPDPGLAKSLYGMGEIMVLPAAAIGCYSGRSNTWS
ncbi:ammonia channel protein AmtB [Labrenzia sp. EL_13]|nr:ammonia channel protein AmtB [Labrenzia sp. EL_13]